MSTSDLFQSEKKLTAVEWVRADERIADLTVKFGDCRQQLQQAVEQGDAVSVDIIAQEMTILTEERTNLQAAQRGNLHMIATYRENRMLGEDMSKKVD